jgi:hypothetical protein
VPQISYYASFAKEKYFKHINLWFLGSRVSCGARAVSNEGNPGLELLSTQVTIAQDSGICMPRVMGSFGAEPFSAKIKYTGK